MSRWTDQHLISFLGAMTAHGHCATIIDESYSDAMRAFRFELQENI